MANSLLSTATRIHLYGELGLAALYSLNINVGKVERSNNNKEDYDRIKDFIIKFLEKAAEKRVKVFLPVDFIVS